MEGQSNGSHKVRFGLLACADICRKVGRAIQMSKGARLYALSSRSLEKAKAFAEANHFPDDMKLYGSYQDLLDDPFVDVVYVPLPTSLHLQWVLNAAKKKKHILVEKPPALTVKEMDEMIDACNSNGVQLMDGTMWLHHPRTSRMAQVLQDPLLFGEIKEVHAVFSYMASPSFYEDNIRVKPDLDSLGAQGDIGWYCCTAILWANKYEMPQTVRAMPSPKFNDAGVVLRCGATFTWDDGRIATYHVSFLSHAAMDLIIQGTKGTLRVEDFCIPHDETWASFKSISDMKPKPLFIGWENVPEEQKVVADVPQEVSLIENMSNLVKGIRDERAKIDTFWPTITRKAQVLLNAVMDSIYSNFDTIHIL